MLEGILNEVPEVCAHILGASENATMGYSIGAEVW